MVAKSGTKSAAGSKTGTRAKSATRASSTRSGGGTSASGGAKSGGSAKTGRSAKSANPLAAIHIPKSYRDAAGKIAELSRNPLVLEVAAAGLVAAAGAMMRNKSARAAVGKVGGSARDAAADTADLAGRIGHAVAAAITNATQRLSGSGEDEQESGEEDSSAAPAQSRQRSASATKQRPLAATNEGTASATKRRGPIKSKGAMPYVS